MATQLKAYLDRFQAEGSDELITSTAIVASDKRALDVSIAEGTVTIGGGSVDTVPSGLSTEGKITEVTLSDSSWTALPATALSGRNGMGVQNDSATQIKIGFDSGESGYVGWSVNINGEFFIDVTDAITVYAKAQTGSPTVTVMEVS